MKSLFLNFLLLAILGSCYPKLEVPGFNSESWENRKDACEDGLAQGTLLLNHSYLLLTNGEVQIKALLGEPDEHELYTRNEKFFYYDLTSDTCQTQKRLSIRFNALDRAKEVTVIVR